MDVEPVEEQVQYVYSKKQLIAIIVGGTSEFIVSICVIMGFNAAMKANINQGISSSIMIFNAVLVTIGSKYFFTERVSCVQLIGILVVIAAVALVSIKKEDTEELDLSSISIMPSEIDEVSKAKQMVIVCIWGIIGAIFLSVEILTNKWLIIRRGVNGDISGMFFLLVEGTIGTVCLIITTIMGSGLHDMTGESFTMIMIAGILAFAALVMLNYAISIGLAGVAISIFNTNAAI